jgi:hypothetical protein
VEIAYAADGEYRQKETKNLDPHAEV